MPDLLGQYYNDIQDRWDEVKRKLRTIKVKTQDGAFTLIKDCVLVDVNRDKEPFPDISFDNQVDSSVIATRSAKKLLLDIAGIMCYNKLLPNGEQGRGEEGVAAALVRSAVHRAAQVFNKGTIHPRVDAPDAVALIQGHGSLFHGRVSFKHSFVFPGCHFHYSMTGGQVKRGKPCCEKFPGT